jgi:hypothetical protein
MLGESGPVGAKRVGDGIDAMRSEVLGALTF